MEFVRNNWRYLLGAALLHALFGGLFALTMLSLPRNVPPPQLAINAVLTIDPNLAAQAARSEKAARERAKAEQEKAAREKAAQEQRQKEEDSQQAQQKEAEQRTQAERQVEAQQKQAKEQHRIKEEQQVREKQETQRKQQAEVEKQRQAEAKADSERKRVADIKRRQDEEAQKRKSAEDARDKAARETELKNQMAEEEGRQRAENAGLLSQYAALIQQHIVRNWNRPPSARPGLECEVKVAQTPTGTVLSAQVTRCNGDTAVQASIEAAVLRASPLPPPPDPSLFERNLTLIFRPTE